MISLIIWNLEGVGICSAGTLGPGSLIGMEVWNLVQKKKWRETKNW